MSEHVARLPGDQFLLLFLQANNQADQECLLAELISLHAEPIIKSVLRQRLRFYLDHKANSDNPDAEDLYSEILLLLVKRLRECKTNASEDKAIKDFRGYVAVVAHNACNAYLRRKYPQRSGLKNSLYYLVRHHPDFTLWQGDDGESICGFAIWRADKTPAAGARRITELQENPRVCLETEVSGAVMKSLDLADLLAAVLRWAEGPVKLDRLMLILSDLRGIKDQPVVSLDKEETRSSKDLIDPQQNAAFVIENRSSLRQLWVEICQLPPRQRSALLLHLKDAQGYALVNLLPETQTATRGQIAEALEIDLEQFLSLRDHLPLDDLSIAEILGATRQQVIKLRDSARRRLARRMKVIQGGKFNSSR